MINQNCNLITVLQDDLTISMLDKCKESQPVIQRIVQSTSDDESLLFEALHLNDELQQVISKFDGFQLSKKLDAQQPEEPEESNSVVAQPPPLVGASDANKSAETPQVENSRSAGADLLNEDMESPKAEQAKSDVAKLLKESPKAESSKPVAAELPDEGVKLPISVNAKPAAAAADLLNEGTESSSEKK